jgi:hypothetical protein
MPLAFPTTLAERLMQIGRLFIGKDYFLLCKAIQLHTKKFSVGRELHDCVCSLSLSVLTVAINAMIKYVKTCLIKYHAVQTYMAAGIKLQAPTVFPGESPRYP